MALHDRTGTTLVVQHMPNLVYGYTAVIARLSLTFNVFSDRYIVAIAAPQDSYTQMGRPRTIRGTPCVSVVEVTRSNLLRLSYLQNDAVPARRISGTSCIMSTVLSLAERQTRRTSYIVYMIL